MFKKDANTAKGPNDDLQWPKSTVEMTDRDFDKIVKKYPIVVVDCWAPWCAPCRMVGPVIEAMAKDHRGKIVYGKLNVDENNNIANKYKIMSIPTILIFKNGKLVDQLIGAMPRKMLEPAITRHM